MKKRDELDTPESTWRRTQLDEPVFILCGRDKLAPHAIRAWASFAKIADVPKSKILEAETLANEVEAWQAVKGSKLPD